MHVLTPSGPTHTLVLLVRVALLCYPLSIMLRPRGVSTAVATPILVVARGDGVNVAREAFRSAWGITHTRPFCVPDRGAANTSTVVRRVSFPGWCLLFLLLSSSSIVAAPRGWDASLTSNWFI